MLNSKHVEYLRSFHNINSADSIDSYQNGAAEQLIVKGVGIDKGTCAERGISLSSRARIGHVGLIPIISVAMSF